MTPCSYIVLGIFGFVDFGFASFFWGFGLGADFFAPFAIVGNAEFE
jgi:hypothetical protein